MGCACTGNAGTFSSPPRVNYPDMHHGTCMMHVPWCMPESLTSGFPWSRWQGKCSRHSRRKRNPQFYVSGKRPMVWYSLSDILGNDLQGHLINISISNYFSTLMKYSFTFQLINLENFISFHGQKTKYQGLLWPNKQLKSFELLVIIFMHRSIILWTLLHSLATVHYATFNNNV